MHCDSENLSKNNLAGALRGQGEFEEAAALLSESLDLNKTVRGPDHPETATSSANLADVLVELGRFDEARRYCENALACGRDRWPASPRAAHAGVADQAPAR